MTTRRILGIDPGIARTGYGLIRVEGNAASLEACGLLTTSAGDDAPVRLLQLTRQLTKLLAELTPDEVAVERLFFATNTKTALQVAEARGVVLSTIASSGHGIGEYTPLQVKQSVAGYGKADKSQVARMVCRLLNLETAPKPDDVTDALAIALCHGQWLKLPDRQT